MKTRADVERRYAARQAKIARMLASVENAEMPAKAREAMATLDEIFEIDPTNARALRLRARISPLWRRRIRQQLGHQLRPDPGGRIRDGEPRSRRWSA